MSMKKVVIKDEKFELMDVEPQYEGNYDKGYIGFCYDKSSLISKIIAKLTNYCCDTGIKISHALIVTGKNTCIEADAAEGKVIQSSLTKYFDNPDKMISFRKPKDLDSDIANGIVVTANSKIGCPYEFKQIISHGENALPGVNQFNKWTNNFFVNMQAQFLDNPDEFICSELAAYCLKYSSEKWEFRNKGILARPTCRVNPQELFEDKTIFKDWIFENATEHSLQV